MSEAYRKEKRYVLWRLALYLEDAVNQDFEWIEETPDGDGTVDKKTEGLRRKAIEEVKAEMLRRGYE